MSAINNAPANRWPDIERNAILRAAMQTIADTNESPETRAAAEVATRPRRTGLEGANLAELRRARELREQLQQIHRAIAARGGKRYVPGLEPGIEPHDSDREQ